MPCARARHEKQAIKEIELLRDTHTHILRTFRYNAFYKMIRGKRPERFNGTSDISFKEFITYVSDRLNSGKGINEHLDTYQHLCNPCVLNYNFIGKKDQQID